MQTRVQKWGNSLGLRIPKALADQLRIAEGSVIDIRTEDRRLVIEHVAPREHTLDELLLGITDENRHGEVSTGGAVGEEAW